MNVDSAFNCGTGMFGVWSSAVTVSGTKTLNIQHYAGSDMASLTHYDTGVELAVLDGPAPSKIQKKPSDPTGKLFPSAVSGGSFLYGGGLRCPESRSTRPGGPLR